MKKRNLKAMLRALWFEKILFAAYLLLGAYFTNLALDDTLWKRYTLHITITVLAIFFDVLFFRLAYRILKRKVIPSIRQGIRKASSFVSRRIRNLTGKLSSRTRNGKIFVEGTEERRFVMEKRNVKNSGKKKKMPKLSKNPTARERARYEYTAFVFKKDKNIPSVLTPSEVAVFLDEKGENREIFTNYNVARYSEEED